MNDSADGESLAAPGAGQGRPAQPLARTPAQAPEFSTAGGDSPPHPATEAARPQPADAPAWERTATATGGSRPGGAARHGRAGSPEPTTVTVHSPAPPEKLYDRGVPGLAPAEPAGGGQGNVSAEEVWRTGQFPRRPARRRHWQRQAGAALTAVLLVASGVVVFLRLHHAPLTVTGVAITSQARDGCAANVTGRIGTSGGSGTVSYQWVFTPQTAAPQPLSQSVAAGQSAVYVTVSVQGSGHGQAAQQVTLQVLGPGQGSASTHVNLSC